MVEIIKNNDVTYSNSILSKLKSNNIDKCDWLKINGSNAIQHNFMAFDNGELIGGAVGFIQYNWYFLDFLYVNKDYRKHNVGTLLMKDIEELAKKEKLTGIRMETWDFQARGFYEKLGYDVWGELKDCPPGTSVFCLKKVL